MKVLVAASTRPEVIKLAPVLLELKKRGIAHVFATTGQHYDTLLFKRFIDDLGLQEPDYNIEVGSASQAVQTGMAMIGLEDVLKKEAPDVVVVEGDTNSVLAGALAAVKLKIPVAHVEAGLRSLDRTMPEEINRILADHCSEVLFAPTETAALNLVNEGIAPEKIHIVGNTIVDAVRTYLTKAEKTSNILENIPEDYYLLTLHRAENTDSAERLENIFNALRELKRPVVFPMHPRTRAIIKGTALENTLKSEHIHVFEPVGYLNFLVLLKNAYAVLTDSGGVQEEAVTLKTPCLTLRYNTERPESVWAGGNIVVGTRKEDILAQAARLEDPKVYGKMTPSENPFGDGRAGELIVRILSELHRGGRLALRSSDTRRAFKTRAVQAVDRTLVGKKVMDAGLAIIRVFDDETVRFPHPDLILKEGMQIEIEKDR